MKYQEYYEAVKRLVNKGEVAVTGKFRGKKAAIIKIWQEEDS